jgi:SAM-dependent methyltransferase
MPLYDIRKILDQPWIYSFMRYVTLPGSNRDLFAREYVRAKPGDRILDLGCGPADILISLHDVDYVGIDQEPRYIELARRRFGARGTFHCGHADTRFLAELDLGKFDVVFAHGLIHHLDDEQAHEFFETARGALRPGGRVVTADGVFEPRQSRLTRFLLEGDRGNFVRTRPQYEEIARSTFANVETEIRRDVFRLPYSLILLQCGEA